MRRIWKFILKDISNMPNLKKNFGTKYILIADSGSYPTNTKAGAIRYIKKTAEYRKRVNKPTIEITISR